MIPMTYLKVWRFAWELGYAAASALRLVYGRIGAVIMLAGLCGACSTVFATSPAAGIAGPSKLGVGQVGTWEYSAFDVDGDLVRWRVSLNTNPPAQWSSITGTARAASFNYSFPSAGSYVFSIEVEDSTQVVETRSITVVVSANQPPSAAISGSTSLAVGQTGSWTFSAADPEGALLQWRVSLNTNFPLAQWTNISGGSQASSFTYTFNQTGAYAFNLEVMDAAGQTTVRSIPVTVGGAGTWSTPAYDPGYWNTIHVQPYNNCYGYANNVLRNRHAQPGYGAGYNSAPAQQFECIYTANLVAGALADGLEPTDAWSTSPTGKTKLALVIWPGRDYHWYRQDSNGLWSHKQSYLPATNLDFSNNLISNPETANRREYQIFGGYFFTPSSSVQGDGKAHVW